MRLRHKLRSLSFDGKSLREASFMRPMSDQNPVCILIIDDQKADRMANIVECKKVFRAHSGGLEIDEASGIEEAIQKMASRIYQIILLDKDLGTDASGDLISGIDHIRLLQEIQPVSQIIMLTASEKPHEISRALRNGGRRAGCPT
jgi:DNA-binding NarL/FixJ family response regulator